MYETISQPVRRSTLVCHWTCLGDFVWCYCSSSVQYFYSRYWISSQLRIRLFIKRSSCHPRLLEWLAVFLFQRFYFPSRRERRFERILITVEEHSHFHPLKLKCAMHVQQCFSTADHRPCQGFFQNPWQIIILWY